MHIIKKLKRDHPVSFNEIANTKNFNQEFDTSMKKIIDSSEYQNITNTFSDEVAVRTQNATNTNILISKTAVPLQDVAIPSNENSMNQLPSNVMQPHDGIATKKINDITMKDHSENKMISNISKAELLLDLDLAEYLECTDSEYVPEFLNNSEIENSAENDENVIESNSPSTSYDKNIETHYNTDYTDMDPEDRNNQNESYVNV